MSDWQTTKLVDTKELDTELTVFSIGSVKLVFPQNLISLAQEIKD